MRKYIVSLVFCFLICGFNKSYSVDWKLLTSSQSGDCLQLSRPPCTYVCDEPGLPRIPINEEEYLHNSHAFMLKTNPVTQRLIFESKFNNGSIFDLYLFNNFGQLVSITNSNINQSIQAVEIDVTSLNTGIYFYKIHKDNVFFSSGRVLIIK